jgi:hypothetical protein
MITYGLLNELNGLPDIKNCLLLQHDAMMLFGQVKKKSLVLIT